MVCTAHAQHRETPYINFARPKAHKAKRPPAEAPKRSAGDSLAHRPCANSSGAKVRKAKRPPAEAPKRSAGNSLEDKKNGAA